MSGNSTPRVIVDGRDLRLAQNVMQFQGGPAYFRTMGFRLLRGRDFADADQPDAQRVAVVNNAFAQRFWPGGDALGHRIGLPPDTIDATIVGVIEDGKYSRLDETQQLAVFGASKQQRSAFARRGLIVRTADPKRVIPELQKLIPAVDPAVPVSFVRPLTELIERGVLPQRLGSWLLSGLGAVALMLAVLGIYGLLACLVAQRTYEIGIRVALGAERRDVARLVLGSVVWSVGAGVVAGTITVWWLSSFISKLLFGVGPHDSLALASTLALIAAAALAGAAGPARRATRVDPVVALRAE